MVHCQASHSLTSGYKSEIRWNNDKCQETIPTTSRLACEESKYQMYLVCIYSYIHVFLFFFPTLFYFSFSFSSPTHLCLWTNLFSSMKLNPTDTTINSCVHNRYLGNLVGIVIFAKRRILHINIFMLYTISFENVKQTVRYPYNRKKLHAKYVFRYI